MGEFKGGGAWNAFPWDELRRRAEAGWVARGGALVAPLLAACAARGVQLALYSRVDGLLTERGRVSGVSVVTEGTAVRRTVGATAGVVLSCGGFERNGG